MSFAVVDRRLLMDRSVPGRIGVSLPPLDLSLIHI